MNEDLIEQISNLIGLLKPEIRNRATFVFGDTKDEATEKLVLADTAFMTHPPVITFYLKSIERMNVSEDILRQIISHEIIHTFSKSELEAYSKQKDMDFFESNQMAD